MRIFKTYGLFAILFLLLQQVSAQKTLQVVTKTINKSIPFKSKYDLNIEGEKANIDIQVWDEERIKLKLKLFAKHPNKKTAESDLEKMKYIADRIDKTIFLRNYIGIKKGDEKPKSNLKAEYTLFIPRTCKVNLTNYFGAMNIDGLENDLNIKSEFSDVNLLNISSETEINSRFGEINIEKLKGELKINSRRSDINLREIQAPCKIRAKFGEIKVYTDEEMKDYDIKGEKSKIHFFNSSLIDLEYNLSSNFGKVFVPEEWGFEYLKKTKNQQKLSLKNSNHIARVKIETEFGEIKISQ